MPTKAGTFRSRTTPGVDPVSGLDFEPTGLFVVVMLADFSDLSTMSGEIFTSYTVTDGTTTRCASIRVDNGASTSATARAWWDSIVQIDTAASVVAEGDITLTADGFEINWTTISAAWSVCWFAVGGDIESKVLLFNRSSTGSASVTGAGFEPKALIGIGAGEGAAPLAQATDSVLLLGLVDENVAQVGVGVTSRDNDSSPNAGGRMSATAFLTRTNVGTTLETDIACTSLDADGFSYNASTHPATSRFYAVLCLGGDGLLASSVEDLVADTTPGAHTQTMSGLPFEPKAGVIASSSQTAYGNTTSGHATITTGAFDTDLDQWGAAFSDRNGVAVSNSREHPSATSALLAVTLTGSPPSLDALGPVSAVGATSLDVDWSAVKDNAIQFIWPTLLLDVNLVPPPPPPVVVVPPTDDELLDLTFGQRTSTFAYELLDAANQPVGFVDVDVTQGPPTISNDVNRTIHRTMSSLVLPPHVMADINPLVHRIRPQIVLSNGSRFPLGVFLFADLSGEPFSFGEIGHGSMGDQGIILDQPSDQSSAYNPGTLLADALAAEFRKAGLTAWEIDPAITGVVGAPVAWAAGVLRSTICTDLCDLAGAYHPYFDNVGIITVRKVDDLPTATPDLDYWTDQRSRIFDATTTVSSDVLDAPNRFIVIDGAASGSPIVGKYDIPDEAPHSRAQRGFVVAEVIRADGLDSVAAAQAQARAAYASGGGAAFEHVNFSTPPDPRHDTFDVIAYNGVNFAELDWSMPLAEGATMTHHLRRAYVPTVPGEEA